MSASGTNDNTNDGLGDGLSGRRLGDRIGDGIERRVGDTPSPFADLAPEPVLGPLVREPEGAGDASTAANTLEKTTRNTAAKAKGRGGVGEGPYGIARLYGTPTNPVPAGAEAGTLVTEDGVTLRTAVFPTATRPRAGTIVLLQGRNECIEKYFETASDLTARGHRVITFDWRGQGGSERLLADPMKGHVRSFRDYERDLATVLEWVLADARGPLTLVGHSMGGMLALLSATTAPPAVRRIVALAPLLRLVEQPLGHRGLKWGMALMRALGLGRLYAAGGPRPAEIPDFLTNVLTTDPGRHERNGELFLEHRHLGLGGPTVSWVHAALVAMDRMGRERTLRDMRVPSLLIAAGDDQVVSTPAQERIVRRMRNANVLTVDGARHELLQERDRYREQVIAAIHAFAARPDGQKETDGSESMDGMDPDQASATDPNGAPFDDPTGDPSPGDPLPANAPTEPEEARPDEAPKAPTEPA